MKRFQWIGSDGWADRNDVVEDLEEEAEGSFSIRIHAPKIPGFRQYYTALHPENNTMNPWFREFWQQKFKFVFKLKKKPKFKFMQNKYLFYSFIFFFSIQITKI